MISDDDAGGRRRFGRGLIAIRSLPPQVPLDYPDNVNRTANREKNKLNRRLYSDSSENEASFLKLSGRSRYFQCVTRQGSTALRYSAHIDQGVVIVTTWPKSSALRPWLISGFEKHMGRLELRFNFLVGTANPRLLAGLGAKIFRTGPDTYRILKPRPGLPNPDFWKALIMTPANPNAPQSAPDAFRGGGGFVNEVLTNSQCRNGYPMHRRLLVSQTIKIA